MYSLPVPDEYFNVMGVFFAMCAAALLLPLLAIGAGMIRRELFQRAGRAVWRKNRIVAVEYAPPYKLRPAEIAYLYDRTFGEEELLATLFDLQHRKKLTLEKVESPDNFLVTPIASPSDKELRPFEQEVIVYLRNYSSRPTWSNLRYDINLISTPYAKALADDLIANGYLMDDTSRLRETVLRWGVASVLALILLAMGILQIIHTVPVGFSEDYRSLTISASLPPLIMMSIVILGLMGLSLKICGQLYAHFARTQLASPMLRAIWPQIEGYRIYLEQVELRRIAFANQGEEKWVLDTVLPYAIALNLTTDWQSRFDTARRTPHR